MFFDSFAWLEYLQGTGKGRRVRELLDESPAAYVCPVVLSEVFSKIGRVDAFVLSSARSRGVRVVTGDPHFDGLDDAEML